MSNKKDREKRREERIQAEAQAGSGDRRARLLQYGAGAMFLVVAAVVVLIVVNGTSSSGGDASNIKDAAAVNQLFQGIAQKETLLGDPKAPVELREYGDLQCPVCKAYSEEILPPIIEKEVKAGKVKISFQNFVIIGEESIPAGAAALAAGKQGRGWTYIELFYRNQGTENSGYVTEEFIEAVGKAAGVKSLAKWNEERKAAALTNEVEATTQEAKDFGFTGTPSFAVKGPSSNGLELLGSPGSTSALQEAIAQAS
jgi:protein-disulfide isomerase